MTKDIERTPFKIVGGYQNTKVNYEDLALTPYLFLVNPSEIRKYKCLIIGIGICWLHQAVYIGLGVNLPRKYNSLWNHNKRKI